MVVNVDMVNLVAASTGQPDEKDKLVVATKANNSYTYTPSEAGEHTLNLETTENAAGECSVTISASGFSDASDVVEQMNIITIAAGKLITNIARRNGFANNGTIYIYSNSDYTGSSVGYNYTRSNYNNYTNGKATNSEAISLTGVKDTDTLYIRYVNAIRTYSGSFTIKDATDNNGATITLTEN